MQRGDIVTVSLPRDYGKPRPALVVQSDLLQELDSVLVCPITCVLSSKNSCSDYKVARL